MVTEQCTAAEWTKEIPTAEGWYWINYRIGLGRRAVCPCQVTRLPDGTAFVKTARGVGFGASTKKFFDMADAEFWSEPIQRPPAPLDIR